VLSTKVAVYDAPAIADRILQLNNTGTPYVVVENQDPASGGASAAIRFQESDDGTNWTDIPDTSATVLPGGKSVATSVLSSRARIALHAGGNVKLLVSVIRTVDGSPIDLGAA